MNILLICPIRSNFNTGAANAVNYTYQVLKKKNKINFINTAEGVTESNIRKFSFIRIILSFKIFFKFFFQLFLNKKIYIVVSMSKFGFIRDAVFIIFSRVFLKKIILHLHGAGFKKHFYENQNQIMQKLIRFVYSLVDRLIILSDKIKDDFFFIEKKKIFILPNFIPHIEKNIRHEVNLRDFNLIKIIFLSNMIYSKGYMTLLETCKILKEKKIPFVCKFIGKFIDDYGDKFEEKKFLKKKFFDEISNYDLENCVFLDENFVSEKKFEKLLSSNLFILPSFYSGEGMPLSIIEAMSCGLPIIATNQGAISDLVTHGYNGYLLKNKQDFNELANYILNLQTNHKLLKDMSINSYEVYNQKFNLEKNNKFIHEAFEI